MSYWGSHYSGLREQAKDDGVEEGQEDAQTMELRSSLNITKEQFQELKECFKLCDKSGKGTLTGVELKALMKSVGDDPDGEDIQEIMYEVDLDGNGEIDFMEFVHVMHKNVKQPITDANMEQCFKVFDSDENGYITIRGLERVFLSLGQQCSTTELKDMISFIDSDAEEGLVTIEYFKKYLEGEKLLRRDDDVDPYIRPRSVRSTRSKK
ncbi:calmodulin-A-like [Rhopilema esculentum]|uniref:calmodulin-A-like n=1 Tax=Rhopilema esculentum TaxID=499914 RepID=UPI0031D62A3B|eukprot:gene2778-1001_t